MYYDIQIKPSQMVRYHYVVYRGQYAIYDTIKLTVTCNNTIIILDDILLLYNGSHINSRGVCFVMLDRKLNLYLHDTDMEGYITKYKLTDLPSALYFGYYQCIATIGNVNICYNSQDQSYFQIYLPDQPMCVTSNHIIYYINNILTSVSLRHSNVFKPINLRCPYQVKRLYPYNLGCIIRTKEDKYYICPYNINNNKYNINILGKIFTVSNDYVHLYNLDYMDIHDMGYLETLYIYDGNSTYYDNDVIDGHYNIQRYIIDKEKNIATYRLQPIYSNIKNKFLNRIFIGFEDIIVNIQHDR